MLIANAYLGLNYAFLFGSGAISVIGMDTKNVDP